MSCTGITWKALIVALLLSVGLPLGLAQTGAGSIQGTVTDPGGAVVPNALVKIVKVSTNEVFNTVTNSTGFYSVPSLFVGSYNITVTASGMSRWESSLTLQAGQTAVLNPHLVMGTVTSQVTVAGDQTTAINTENSTQDTTVGRQQIEQIPENGRAIYNILGSVTPGYQNYGNQPRLNGLVWGALSWSQDGAPMDYRDGGGLDNVSPDPDTVQEMRIESSNSTAKSDRPAYVIVSTKSGTNSFHGSAFETNRDSSFGVAHNRQDSNSAKPPKYIRNEYGISAGGPVLIPHLYDGRDKTFFFGSWEAMSLRQNQYKFYYVPTAAMRNGDFSQAFDSNGNLYKLYDPNTTSPGSASGSTVTGWQRQQFAYNGIPNTIDPARISPLAKALYAITPLPTNAGNPYAASTGNWQGSLPVSQQQYDYTMRFDRHFSDANTAFFRYSLGHRLQYNLGSSEGAPTTDGIWNGQFQPVDSQSGVLSYTHIASPTFYQTATISMDYQSWKQQGSPGSVVNKNIATQLGLENTFGNLGLPQIVGGNGNQNYKSQGTQNSLLQSYDQGSNPWRDSDYTNTFADDLTWIRGRHQLQFGGEYRHDQLRIQPDQARPAIVTFGGLGTGNLDTGSGTAFTPQPFTGLAAADFFLGDAQSYTNDVSPAYLYMRDQEASVYFQDDFHLRPNLTLNLGLRYEALPALHEKNNQFSSFDYARAAIVTGQPISTLLATKRTTQALIDSMEAIGVIFETPEQAHMPAGVFKNYWWNFLPRVGVAWMPLGDRAGLVFRGGYGEYAYKTPARNLYGGFNESFPYTASLSQDNTNGLQTDGLANYILRSQQTVVAGGNSTGVINPNVQKSICIGCFGLTNVSPDMKPEGYREWDFTIEQDFHNRTSLSVSYMGNHGYNLEQFWATNTAPSPYVWYATTNQPVPSGTPNYRSAWRVYNQTTYGEITQIRKTGFSNANMVQVVFHRTFYKGYEYNISYVFGRYFRAGGNGSRDSTVYPAGVFMPGTVPTDPHELVRSETYIQDNGMPRQQIKYDWVINLPVGKGRWLLSGANRVVNTLIGGWEIAGTGIMNQTLFQPSAGDWGPISNFHYYGRSKPIKDCTSGTCRRAYYAYNGFVTKAQYNTANGYQGLPGSYADEKAGGAQHQPLQPDQGTNFAPQSVASNPACKKGQGWLLADGSCVTNVGYAPGASSILNPNYRFYAANPFNFSTDASLFKVFPITERVGLKVNGDFFNVFNQQGTTGVNGSTGIITTTSSANVARIIQVSARLTW